MVDKIRGRHRNDKASGLLIKALDFEKMGLAEDAEKCFESLIDQHPEYELGWTSFGIFLFNHGRKEDAIDLMKRASELLESNSGVLTYLGSFLQADHRDDEALYAFQDAAARNPHDVSSLSALISTSESLDLPDDAAEAYAGILKVKRNSYYWWDKYGGFLLSQERYTDSENAFREALKYNPRCYHAWVQLGLVLFKQDEVDEAVKAYEAATEIEPFTGYAYYTLGTLLEDADLVDSTVRERLESISPLVRSTLSFSISVDGDVQQIELKYRKLSKKNPKSVIIWRMLGKLFLAQSKYHEAEIAFGHAIKIEYDSFDDLAHLGISLIKQNKLQEGITIIRKAIAMDPDNPESRSLEKLIRAV